MSSNILIFICSLLLLPLTGGVILVQVLLSRRPSRWLGLLLPGAFFLCSLAATLGFAVYMGPAGLAGVPDVVVLFLLVNLPTTVLLAIYWGCRGKFRKREELKKMNVQDLG